MRIIIMSAIRKTAILGLCVLLAALFGGCAGTDGTDAADIGFRDEAFDRLAGGRDRLADFMTCIDRDACLKLFETYSRMEHTVY